MNTQLLSALDDQTPAIAAELIRRGELVAIPTETVYGLGADGLNEAAVAKIFEAKGRPQDNPLILHIWDAEQMEQFCHDIPKAAYDLAKAFWPGPLTMVLPARDIVPKRTTGGLNTVALRCPDNAVTREIIRLSGVPIAAPSANLSGKPSTTTAQHVLHDHDGKIAAVVDGGPCRVGVESTIVDLTEDRPRLLRPGGITPDQLMSVLGDLVVDKAVTAQIDKDAVVKAPGMKYRHYAPAEPVVIVAGSRDKAAAYIHRHFTPGDRVLCFEEELPLYADCAPLSYGREADANTLSAGLFSALRELDDPRIHQVYARCPVGGGVAYAVQNRLKKAAAFHIVDAEVEE
ncbi:MAG: threonylcarbamoyl-AMP synthase [Clostridiales bacterium]|nr:threonylcarbamoyl-AMP synthase [Clostridiales bacterium]